jgi:hypothetical protein
MGAYLSKLPAINQNALSRAVNRAQIMRAREDKDLSKFARGRSKSLPGEPLYLRMKQLEREYLDPECIPVLVRYGRRSIHCTNLSPKKSATTPNIRNGII